MIDSIWKAGADAVSNVDPPKPNQYGTVPFTRIIHHLDDLNSLYRSISVDADVAGFIQKKSPTFSETNHRRELITLNLMWFKDVFTVHIWIIPLYQDGVLTSQLYAADDENQMILMNYRNPATPGPNDYTIL